MKKDEANIMIDELLEITLETSHIQHKEFFVCESDSFLRNIYWLHYDFSTGIWIYMRIWFDVTRNQFTFKAKFFIFLSFSNKFSTLNLNRFDFLSTVQIKWACLKYFLSNWIIWMIKSRILMLYASGLNNIGVHRFLTSLHVGDSENKFLKRRRSKHWKSSIIGCNFVHL